MLLCPFQAGFCVHLNFCYITCCKIIINLYNVLVWHMLQHYAHLILIVNPKSALPPTQEAVPSAGTAATTDVPLVALENDFRSHYKRPSY